MPLDYLAFVDGTGRFFLFLFLFLFVAAILDKLLVLLFPDDVLPNTRFKTASPPPGCFVREEVIRRKMMLVKS